jgi:DNA-binding response OmpR family regulator
VFSGFAASDLAEKALRLGAHDYVEKGAPLHELTDRVKAIAS